MSFPARALEVAKTFEYLLRGSPADGSPEAHLDEHQVGESAAPLPQGHRPAAAYRSQLLVRHRLPISKQPLEYRSAARRAVIRSSPAPLAIPVKAEQVAARPYVYALAALGVIVRFCRDEVRRDHQVTATEVAASVRGSSARRAGHGLVGAHHVLARARWR